MAVSPQISENCGYEDTPITIDAYRQTLANEGACVHILPESESELESHLEGINHMDCSLSDYRLSQTTGDVLKQSRQRPKGGPSHPEIS